jgi:hypothetical protein
VRAWLDCTKFILMLPSSPALIQQYSQRDVRTIEGVLFEAMVKAGAVSQDNANDPSKVLIQEVSSFGGWY